jgi:predicted ribosomally synthesized peptide with SipW-like signal peptide
MTAPRLAGRRASIRVRAALAGGLVFGLAAGLTVASWTDAEFVTNTFTAGTINVQTSANGSAYSTTDPLVVSVTGVFPGSTGAVYLPVKVQTTSASVAGTVTMTHAANTTAGLTAALLYRVIRNSATCNATAFTNAATADRIVLSQNVSALTGSTTVGSAMANSGNELLLCFEFTLPTTAAAALRSTSTPALTWTFTATSS